MSSASQRIASVPRRSPVNLSAADNSAYTVGRSKFFWALWYFLGAPLLKSYFLPSSSFKIAILRLFGASIGSSVYMKPGIKVKFPWRLTIGDNSWVGEDVWIDNMAQVTIGADACVSQGSYICTGNHDWSSRNMKLFTKPVVIEDGAWVAAHKNAHLLVAGPEYPEAASAAREIIARNNIQSSVTFAGTLAGSDKLAALSLARCFCLPSYSEGQSVAVLEALSIGLPVVITSACNVDGVAEAGAGFVGSNSPAELTRSVITILDQRDAAWLQMSQSAQKLAETSFNWNNIGLKMHAVYVWMLGGPKPEYVIG